MATNLSVRLDDEHEEALDRLVAAVRGFYSAQAEEFPPAAKLARDASRSSALRDLLTAWDQGRCDQFTPPRR